MAYKLKKSKREPKTTGLSAKTQNVQNLNSAHARNQICQTTFEIEEKFSFHAANEVIDV